MFGEQSASRTASRWLSRGGGSRRELKPNPSEGTNEVCAREHANLFAYRSKYFLSLTSIKPRDMLNLVI